MRWGRRSSRARLASEKEIFLERFSFSCSGELFIGSLRRRPSTFWSFLSAKRKWSCIRRRRLIAEVAVSRRPNGKILLVSRLYLSFPLVGMLAGLLSVVCSITSYFIFATLWNFLFSIRGLLLLPSFSFFAFFLALAFVSHRRANLHLISWPNQINLTRYRAETKKLSPNLGSLVSHDYCHTCFFAEYFDDTMGGAGLPWNSTDHPSLAAFTWARMWNFFLTRLVHGLIITFTRTFFFARSRFSSRHADRLFDTESRTVESWEKKVCTQVRAIVFHILARPRPRSEREKVQRGKFKSNRDEKRNALASEELSKINRDGQKKEPRSREIIIWFVEESRSVKITEIQFQPSPRGKKRLWWSAKTLQSRTNVVQCCIKAARHVLTWGLEWKTRLSGHLSASSSEVRVD